MSEHTEGPWRWTRVSFGTIHAPFREEPDGPYDALWSDAENQPVAVTQDVESYAAWIEASDQDAKLIAAAPDLLAACREAAAKFREQENIFRRQNREDAANKYCYLAQTMESAIARAEGEK